MDISDWMHDKDTDPGMRTPNRIDVIRIHVFDSEISDRDGNLIRNEHLDILDYLVSKCNENGIYLWLTPIAWWGSPSPNARVDAFSTITPMQATPGMLISTSGFCSISGRCIRRFGTPAQSNRLLIPPGCGTFRRWTRPSRTVPAKPLQCRFIRAV
ncbi:MAG: hypothetical protein FWH27_01675 [Planctomycetaceae bacterium]|nr:hypothetical protein [Planctomycetaceae bacterium]